MDYPTRPEDLTTTWLSEALKVGVTDFEVERFGEGVGVVGQVIRVRLAGSGVPNSIVAKFPSPAPENRAVAAAYDMYGKEVRFYQRQVDQIDARAPLCLFGAHDPETEGFVLLLEDLEGTRLGDQVAGASIEDARQVVDAMAAMHASTWGKGDALELRSHNNPAQRDGMIAGFDLGWPVVLERFGHVVTASAREAAAHMGATTPQLLDTMCQAPTCLAHADVRLDNLFFDEEGVIFVDWQSICSSAPEQDLAYFLTQSLEPEVRRSEDLAARYRSAIAAAGINYPAATFEQRYAVSALYLFNYAIVIAGTLDLGNDRGALLAEALVRRSITALEELDAFALVQR